MLRCHSLTFLLVLCLMHVHCNLAKPTNSMTRIQEVFRTLMGPKQMMLASRGKKAIFALPVDSPLGDAPEERTAQPLRNPDAYWVVTGESGPVAPLRHYWTWEADARRKR